MKYYFDIGSSTIKLYKYEEELEQIEEKSILFKTGFSESGVTLDNIKKLLEFVKLLKERYKLNKENAEIYATGIWRKIPRQQLELLINEFKNLGLEFIFRHRIPRQRIKTKKLKIYSGIKQEEILQYIIDLLKDESLELNCKIAIHTGGELRFQKLVKYKLQENRFFNDGIHKLYVTYEDFDKKNKELLYNTTLEELHNLMPQNPTWMDGAKAGIMLGQAIFKKANIEYIIPSDLNLIHGVIKEKC